MTITSEAAQHGKPIGMATYCGRCSTLADIVLHDGNLVAICKACGYDEDANEGKAT